MSLSVKNFSVSAGTKSILKDISLTIQPGKVHALMGPNGSGKSTLAQALMGNPQYKVQSSLREISGQVKIKVQIDGKDITSLKTDERARAGMFLAFQTPVAVPGVTVANLLRTAHMAMKSTSKSQTKTTKYNTALTLAQFNQDLLLKAKKLSIPQEFLRRSLNEDFSGGEKKKLEMLQAVALNPKYAVFDEIDTGLDVDALKVVASGIETLRKEGCGILIITHYQRILRFVKPDFVHVMVRGRIAASGSTELVEEIETSGYGKWTGKQL